MAFDVHIRNGKCLCKNIMLTVNVIREYPYHKKMHSSRLEFIQEYPAIQSVGYVLFSNVYLTGAVAEQYGLDIAFRIFLAFYTSKTKILKGVSNSLYNC